MRCQKGRAGRGPALRRAALWAAAAAAGVACATSPLGRSQLKLFPEEQMAQMGIAAYDKMKTEMKATTDARKQAHVRCVANAVTAQVDPSQGPRTWEVTVFEEPSANAFALPGGKIGVHTGLLEVATNQDQLATVIGHEVAHVLAGHSNERVSTAYATQSGLQLVQLIAGASTPGQQQLLGLLGVGAQVGVILPFGRTQESEADLLGLDLMAKAGFDPRQSVPLWQSMAQSGGAAPPELLSTHPAPATRIQKLQERIPQTLPLYEAARAAGRRPSCS